MINFSIRKMGCILLACSLAMSTLLGCTSDEADKLPSSDGQNTAEQTGTKDPFGKYEEPIDIRFVRAVDNNLVADILPKTPGETIEKNRWLDLYSEELGINVIYDWTVSGGFSEDAYKQKSNLTMASGDLPDVFPVTRQQLKQLADSDMIADLTEYYADYSSEMTKENYLLEGDAMLNSATFDGKLMGIPNGDPSIESAQFLWIRADWLKKLKLEPPKTMDDLLAISTAFTTQDPDGNGKDDTYGLALSKGVYGGAMGSEGFFAGFHAYPNFWTEDANGKIAWGSTLPETKEGLKTLAEMYKRGEIDPEFGVKDGGKVAESIASGKIGISFGEQWHPFYPLNQNFNNDNKADWTGYSLVSVDDKPTLVPLKFRNNLYFAVRKDYEHPEALIKMINLHLEKNWGETNDFNKYYMPRENEGVGVWKFSPVTPAPGYKNLEAFLAIDEARANDTIADLKGEAAAIQKNIDDFLNNDFLPSWGWDKIYGVEGVYNVLKKNRDNNELYNEKFSGAPTDTMVERNASLEQMEKEMFVKIIMGEASIDDFDKFVEDWNKLGGEQMTKEVNEWYAATK